MKWLACLPLALAATGCPDVKVDPGEGVGDPSSAGPTVEFDPANKIVPFPNNLLLDPATGKVTLPKQCGETAASGAIRTTVLNRLDGFGTYETALQVTFTAPVDPASVDGHVVLYKRAAGGTAVTPADAMPVPIRVVESHSARFDASCANPQAIDSLAIVPLVPLDQRSTYVVGILAGLQTVDHADYQPSVTWAFVRQATSPVTFEGTTLVSETTPLDPSKPEDLLQLQGIDLLYKAHAKAVAFLAAKGYANTDQLLTWEFTTQTTTDPLDPTVTGSPANMITTDGITAANGTSGPFPLSDIAGTTGSSPRQSYPFKICDDGVPGMASTEPSSTQCFLKLVIGGAASGTNGLGCMSAAECRTPYLVGSSVCTSLGCAAIGKVLQGYTLSRQYQATSPNPLDPTKPIPGQWSDPVNPAYVASAPLQTFIFMPRQVPPSGKVPVAVFQHGLGQSKENAFLIASQLAAAGFATVAIDAQAHGSRAIQISNQGACAGAPTTGRNPGCFAPFLSPDLGATRDNIRQTVLDQETLVAAVAHCGVTPCGDLNADPTKIVYIGQSLGGIIGSVTTAVRSDLKASVLNVPGAGWVDILENTATRDISCSLVDGLIGAGVLVGAPYNNGGTPGDYSDDTGLCTTPEWKQQPGYQQFAVIGRWVLDPADPANFNKKLATKRFLMQEVVGDAVVPNIATEREAALVGLTPADADPGVPNPTPPPPMQPSAAIVTAPMATKYVLYRNLPAAGGFPGNTFQHGSLLAPTPGNDGALATLRMQTDALFYLINNR